MSGIFHLKSLFGAVLAALMVLSFSPAMADDWEVVKLRGGVFAFDGEGWVKLERGSIVSDERVIRTSRNGRAQFVRDGETVDIGRDTQIRIYDEYRDGFTIVQQHFGVVEVEAEVQKVKHFAVQTPHLAAVVKGTRFKVTSDSDRAEVSVERGKVEVRDEAREQSVNVNPGQSATVSDTQPVVVTGSGPVEAVVTFSGEVVVPAQAEASANSANSNNGNRGNAFGRLRDDDDDLDEVDDDEDDGRGNNGNGNGHGAGGNSNSGGSSDDDDADDDDDEKSNNGNGHGAGGTDKSNNGQGHGAGGTDKSNNGKGHGAGGSHDEDD